MATDWSPKKLLFVSGVPAVASLVVTLVIAKRLGTEEMAIYLLVRSVAQIAGSFNLGLPQAMIALAPKLESPRPLVSQASFFALLLVPLQAVAGGLVVGAMLGSSTFGWLAAALTVGVSGVALSSSQNHGLMQTKRLAYGSWTDFAVACVMIVASLFAGLFVLLGLAVARNALRALVQFSAMPAPSAEGAVHNRNIWKTGGSLAFRAPVAVTQQFGDRALIPLLFGIGTAAITGLASTLFAVVYILNSAASNYLLPLMSKQGTSGHKYEQAKALSRLMASVGLLVAVVGVVPLYLLEMLAATDLTVYLVISLALAFNVAQMSLLAALVAQQRGWAATGLQASMLLAFYVPGLVALALGRAGSTVPLLALAALGMAVVLLVTRRTLAETERVRPDPQTMGMVLAAGFFLLVPQASPPALVAVAAGLSLLSLINIVADRHVAGIVRPIWAKISGRMSRSR